MDIVSYALNKKIAEHALSGVQSMSVEGQNLIINTKDSGVLTMTFPTPKDGVSVIDIDVNANNQIVFTMSDGTEFISGKIPTVKGDAGFSPTITENADNTDKIYKLDITTADSTFTTPNLKGGAGGSGEENKIDSISVNGINIVPDENKNVDITVPTVTNDLTDELKSSYDDAVTAKHTHNNKTVLDNITAEKVESWNKAEENVQSDWNETDDTADGFIKNKPTIPDAYDDTALSGRIDDVETSIGDMSTIEVKSVSDLVSAINVLYNAFMSSITYADKKLTITYRNGGTVDIDMSAIITDTNIGELSNIDDTGITDKQVLSYDTATNKYIPTTIDTAGVLADAKKYTDDEIAKINNADAISVDEKPAYSNGTITYKKDGVEKTITDGDFWFFYTVDNMAYQTIWIDGVEFTTSVDGSVDFKDFVSKTNDLTSTYTGEETDKTKVTTIASLDALYAIISTALGKKVNTTDIVDSLVSDATDKPLSAAQGKALDTKISNLVTTVEKDYAKTTDIPTTLPANGGNSDTVNNHTVKTDVPVDAVFTDTIYDDTEVKESIAELNSNLDGLEFGENGVKNLFKDEIKWMENITVTRGTKSVSDGKITLTATSDDCYTDHDEASWKNNGIKTIPCKPNKKYIFSWECEGDSLGFVYIFENGSTNNMSDTINKEHKLPITTSADAEYLTVRVGVSALGASITYWNFQLEEGDTATPYEPYIPSVKMLAEENEQQSIEAMDLKMLGWTVPGECPVQNEVGGNQFIQKVDRIDLSTLSFSELGSFGYYVKIPTSKAPINNSTVANIYLEGFTTVKRIDLDSLLNSIAMTGSKEFCINNGKIAIPSGYLYYELETPVTMTIDGNEATEHINESLSDYGLVNKANGWLQRDSSRIVTPKTSCTEGKTIRFIADYDINYFGGKVFVFYNSSGTQVGDTFSIAKQDSTITVPSGATSFEVLMYKDNGVSASGNYPYSLYVDNAIDELKNDLDGFKFVPFTNADFTYQDSYKFWTKTVSDSSGKNPIAVVVNATNDNTANLTAVIRDGNTIRISSPNYNSIGSLTFTGYYVLM